MGEWVMRQWVAMSELVRVMREGLIDQMKEDQRALMTEKLMLGLVSIQ